MSSGKSGQPFGAAWLAWGSFALAVAHAATAPAPPAPPRDPATRQLIERAVAVRPHPRQLAWQQLEFTCFIHFGVNTFTGREWGTGREDPATFDPRELDADQWVAAAKSAGMRMIMLTAKHHDGFCLWPSAYTGHDVESAAWRDGTGDVVAELAGACAQHGLDLGLYLSPADLAEIERPGGRYGNGSPAVESVIPTPVAGVAGGAGGAGGAGDSGGAGGPAPARTFTYVVDDYNRYFLNQLYELLTRYGPVREVWFDGANPKPGTGQAYRYDAWYELIRQLAPEAVIAIRGPDVRWCGNEAARTRRSEWSVIPLPGPPDQGQWPDLTRDDLGSLDRLRGAAFLHWYPAETNTSLREGWFWRDEQQPVKPAETILDTWYRSVGGNSVFLLNITPDRRGLIPDRDVAVLREVGERLRRTFEVNLARGGKAWPRHVRGVHDFEPEHMLDGDPASCWMPGDWVTLTQVRLELDRPKRFNTLVLQEQIGDYGQRIEGFEIWAAPWRERAATRVLARGTTVGYKRICRFPPITTSRIQVHITGARVCPTLSEVGLYFDPGPPVPADQLTLPSAPPPGAVVLFDGTRSDALHVPGRPGRTEQADRIEHHWPVVGGALEVDRTLGDLVSRVKHGDCLLHVEWMSPPGGAPGSQRNGNSGVKLQGRYEIQITNTAGPPAAPHPREAGAIYGLKAPDCNASGGAGTWQRYDVWFTAPRWEGDRKISNARMTVFWNGVLVHDDVEIPDRTGASPAEAPGDHPVLFQAHESDADGEVRFRNLWLLLDPLAAGYPAPRIARAGPPD